MPVQRRLADPELGGDLAHRQPAFSRIAGAARRRRDQQQVEADLLTYTRPHADTER